MAPIAGDKIEVRRGPNIGTRKRAHSPVHHSDQADPKRELIHKELKPSLLRAAAEAWAAQRREVELEDS